MILSSNNKRSLNGEKALQVKLYVDSIPVFRGVKKLIQSGHRSTFSPSNSRAWALLEKIQSHSPLIDLVFKDSSIDSEEIQFVKELIIDPQTCGPLLVSCQPNTAKYLVENLSWIQIGEVEECI